MEVEIFPYSSYVINHVEQIKIIQKELRKLNVTEYLQPLTLKAQGTLWKTW